MTAFEPEAANTRRTALVLGQGAREHALAEALARSAQVGRVVVAPGHAWFDQQWSTTAPIVRMTPAVNGIEGLVALAERVRPDLVVVGPEQLLADGIVDALTSKGFRVFGPTRAAARLETSKAETRRLMLGLGVPTAPTAIVRSMAEAAAALRTMPARVVVKADGLAAGKGTWICNDHDTALGRIWRLVDAGELGEAGRTVVLEAWIDGEESSVMAICDAETCVVLPPVRDWKRADDGDRGPNTGGLGAVAPWPAHGIDGLETIRRTVFEPVLRALSAQGTPFRGCLYAGLIGEGADLRVLEFNARFGDPETQALLPLFDGDLYGLLEATTSDRLKAFVEAQPLRWSDGVAVAVVLAARGYPGAHEVHPVPERWLRPAPPVSAHAANLVADGERTGGFRNGGGRVVTLVARGRDIAEARSAVDAAIGVVPDGFFRRLDIGLRRKTDTSSTACSNDSSDMAQRIPCDSAQAHFDISSTNLDESVPGNGSNTPKSAAVAAANPIVSTYAAAGVDFARASASLSAATEALRRGRGTRMVSRSDAYAGIVAPDGHDALIAVTIDGLGTKTRLARTADDWRSLGADLVHHALNDLLASGARPWAFVDQISAHRLELGIVAALLEGMANACAAADVALAGGETAEMPDLLQPGAVDVSGTLVGLVDRVMLAAHRAPAEGDRVLALPSNGLHTNGFSLARRIFADVLDMPMAPGQPSWRMWLLAPHRCYTNEIAKLKTGAVGVKGLVHVTGGAFRDNPPRALDAGLAMVLDPWPWPEPFEILAWRGQVARDEMRAVFNLGAGMLVIVAPENVARATALVPELFAVGHIDTRAALAPAVIWKGA